MLVASLLGFGWWLRLRPPPSAPAPIAAAPAPLPLVPLWPASVSPAAAKPAIKGGAHSDEIEICGVGKVKLDGDDLAASGKYLDSLTRNPRRRWLAALRDSGDYRARAAGLYLEGIFDRDSPQKDPEAARDELVQLAVGTKDPAAFALAYTECIKGGPDFASQGACPQLSLDDWAHADSDNAVPWLQLAAKARRENDTAAEAQAMAHAAQAHEYEHYTWSLFSFAEAALPEDVTAAERWILTTEVIGVEAAMPAPYFPLFQYCSRDAQGDTAVHQQCDALAEVMVNKGATLFDLSVGRTLGAHAGWPAARVDKLTQELKASTQAVNQMLPIDGQEQWSCEGIARGNAYMSEWVAFGERGLAGRAIERSGESVAELSRKYDDWMATVMRDAQQSAQAQAPAPQP